MGGRKGVGGKMEAGKKNTLVTIGLIGVQTAYLNVQKDDAVRRYLEKYPEDRGIINEDGFVLEFSFEDEFSVYAAGEQPHPLDVLTSSG